MEENSSVIEMTDLPDEILGLIFKRLSQTDALNTRLVCHKWKDEIDSHYSGWVIQLDDRPPDMQLQHILKLRIKGCKVIRLVDPLPTLDPEVSFFRHPDLIKEVEIKKDVDQYEKIISPQNLHRLLKCCSNNIEVLVLSLTNTLLNNPHHSDFGDPLQGYTFKNLQKLQILFQKELPTQNQPLHFQNMEDNMFHQLIGLSAMPKLKSITITPNIGLSQVSAARLSCEVLSFIAKHGKILQHIKYRNCMQPYQIHVAQQFHDVDLNLLKKVNCLNTLHLSLKSERVISLRTAWKVLLECQTKLQDLQVHNLEFPSTMFRNLMVTNFETVKSVKIGSLTVVDMVVVDGVQRRVCDMSFFSNCLNLEKLTLMTDTLATQQDGGRLPELSNLSKLPAQLKLLNLYHFTIRSDDMLEFSRSHRKLAAIACIGCWSPGDGLEYGVNASIVEELLNQQNVDLKQIEIYESICLDNTDEVADLIAVLEAIGIRNNTAQAVTLFRDVDPLGEWRCVVSFRFFHMYLSLT